MDADLLLQLVSSAADCSVGQALAETDYDGSGIDVDSSPGLLPAGADETTIRRLEELETTNQRLRVQAQSHTLTADKLRQELDSATSRLQEQEAAHAQVLDELRRSGRRNLTRTDCVRNWTGPGISCGRKRPYWRRKWRKHVIRSPICKGKTKSS